MNQEQLFNIFSERFCSEADFVYRFCASVTLNEKDAHRITHDAFKKISSNLAQHANDEYPTMSLVMLCARDILSGPEIKPGQMDHFDPVVTELSHIKDRRARLAFAAADICGFTHTEITTLLTGSPDAIRETAQLLAGARETFYGNRKQTVSPVIWSWLAEAVDDTIPQQLSGEFDQVRKATTAFDNVAAVFRLRRGQLQLAVQSFHMTPAHIEKLKIMVASPEIRHTQEAQKIEEISSYEARRRFLRQMAFAGAFLAIVFTVVYKSAPRKPNLNTLEVLGYESIALIEDGKDRLDLPTDSFDEVKEYLASYPELGFKPKVLTSKSTGLNIEGASVLDYDPTKVSVVVYSDPIRHDRILHFTLPGETSELPKAEPGNFQGLIYQTYASDVMNMIAWNPAPGILAIAAGSRGATELADFVRRGELGM